MIWWGIFLSGGALQGIYCIMNTTNGKRYVGSSKNIKRRLDKYHISLLNKRTHWNHHLQSAWDVNGAESFDFSVLEEVANESDLMTREQYWMDFYNSYNREYGYNLAPRADRTIISEETREKMRVNGIKRGRPTPIGYTHSDEIRRKISEGYSRGSGIEFTPEHRHNIGNHRRGKTYEDIFGKEKADELKEAQSNRATGKAYCLGMKHSEETKRKMSESNIGKHNQSDEARSVMSECKKGTKNPNYKIVDGDTRKEIVRLFWQPTPYTVISNQMGITVYKIKCILSEEGVI
jgi:group I intron endonuclease